jgi:hypothetical protein
VKSDVPPDDAEATCKVDRYAEHAQNGACAFCHGKMDAIGFGLENYDKEGKYRQYDVVDGVAQTQCEISGDGEVAGVGGFNGPAELGKLLVDSGALETCVVRQMYRFAVGRKETATDQAAVARLSDDFRTTRRFDALLIEIASSPQFGFRREEE